MRLKSGMQNAAGDLLLEPRNKNEIRRIFLSAFTKTLLRNALHYWRRNSNFLTQIQTKVSHYLKVNIALLRESEGNKVICVCSGFLLKIYYTRYITKKLLG